jgi:hypothetical protein
VGGECGTGLVENTGRRDGGPGKASFSFAPAANYENNKTNTPPSSDNAATTNPVRTCAGTTHNTSIGQRLASQRFDPGEIRIGQNRAIRIERGSRHAPKLNRKGRPRMKDPASLHNEWLHKNLMQLEDALLSLAGEERHLLRRAWRTLPEQKEEGFMGIPGYAIPATAVRKIILDLLVTVKEEIEAAAGSEAQ